MLKNTRQHLFNSSKGWPLNNPFGPSPSGQGPRRQLPNQGVAKNGELLGPKVKAQLALEARGHVPNADDGSAFVRFGTDAELLIYVSSQLLFLRAEHLDVGFMLSGFRRRHKVSQRPVCLAQS